MSLITDKASLVFCSHFSLPCRNFLHLQDASCFLFHALPFQCAWSVPCSSALASFQHTPSNALILLCTYQAEELGAQINSF